MAEPALLDPVDPFQFTQFEPVTDIDDIEFDLDDLLVLPDGHDFISLITAADDNNVPNSSSNDQTIPPSPESSHSSDNCSGITSQRRNRKRKAENDQSPLPSLTAEDEEKRRARLMRNRDSAQLSRQRKKHYVEELEEKVRVMHSTINDLNSRISFFVAENTALRQQLSAGNGGKGGTVTPPVVGPSAAVYPPTPPMHFPWIPCAGYAIRPNGAPVPLVPIPRLKPQQSTTTAQKTRKSESKKGENKVKKAASVSILGLLFIFLLFGVDFRFGGGGDGSIHSDSRGRVLSVNVGRSSSNGTDEIELCDGKSGFRNGWFDPVTGKRCHAGLDVSSTNSHEQLPALLYVPRNGKHVKVNGNLIIHSVLAGEKAIAHASSRANSGDEKASLKKDGEDTSLAIHGSLVSALALNEFGRDVDKLSKSKERSDENSYGESFKSLNDGPLQQWFREGLAGPILSSGMCTEVFQFDISPTSANPSGIIPAHSISKSTIINTTGSKVPRPLKTKNRRILYSKPIPLAGSNLNDTKQFSNSSESSKIHEDKPTSSMVVSILADPREAGDGDGDGMMSSSRSLSRIFVVVLLDSVKYVTYSCGLPMKSQSPHLVN